jgi:HAD superfamily hydrolase (TIGR01509 family)
MNFDAVLFDCDGVLVDSEPITNGVLREMLGELGWKLTIAECMRLFVGKTIQDEAPLIHANTGVTITAEWIDGFRERRNVALELSLQAIAGAQVAVKALHATYGGQIACASSADRKKVELQLRKVGMLEYFAGRIFSGHELARSKPAPDVYLAAAEALRVDPKRCAVIEDTVTGVTAGVAAGATVLGFSPGDLGHNSAEELLLAGAVRVFTRMEQLPQLLA